MNVLQREANNFACIPLIFGKWWIQKFFSFQIGGPREGLGNVVHTVEIFPLRKITLSKETDFFCHSLLDGRLNFVCYVY